MSALLFFMKDCYALVKEEWDFMNLKDLKQIGCELCIFFFFLEKDTPNKPPQNTKDIKNKGCFLIGEF